MKTEAFAGFWPEAPSRQRGIYFRRDGAARSFAVLPLAEWRDTDWEFWSYDRLMRQAQVAGRVLQGASHSVHGVVLIAADTSPASVVAFLGALQAGLTPAIVAPAQALQSRHLYVQALLQQSLALEAVCVVADAGVCVSLIEQSAALGRSMPSPRARVVALESLVAVDAAGDEPVLRPASFAYLQLTSGTTGPAKAVRIRSEAMLHNLQAIRGWLQWQDHHATASWLPLHHDMGLVGCLLMPLWTQTDLYLMRPAQFVRSPGHYLQCFGLGRAQLSAMPAFGLSLCMHKVAPSRLEGLDFRAWHALVVGAGPLDAGLLRGFASWLEPRGFAQGALCAAYGMAEATLAVCGRRPGQGVLSWDSEQRDQGNGWAGLASSGSALSGLQVSVADESGRPCPDGVLGRVVVRGTSLHAIASPPDARGGQPGADEPVPEVATLDTGDAGWLSRGELFVVGRFGDGIKLQGRWLFAEDVERAVAAQWSELSGNCIALLGRIDGADFAALLIDQRLSALQPASDQFLKAWSADVQGRIYWVPARLLRRTTSGKPMRQALWLDVMNGVLEGVARGHVGSDAIPVDNDMQLELGETST
ncbi:AMP-binding protein [Rubrivivax sp. RP6-9]|uniref:AMP-binding protein n=1 Tax=Rubrivivax sp. RP6-9 TaxID=3415750 RepID=UPI003CC51061